MRTIAVIVTVLALTCSGGSQTPASGLDPSNPFYAPSKLPFQAPPFDKIKDNDYQPAIKAGIAERMKEIEAIANNPAPPDFANTFVALEKSGQLRRRAEAAFGAATAANTNPELQKVEGIEASKLAALDDAEMFNAKLFARVEAIYKKRDALGLDKESKRLVEMIYDR